jgi:peptidoglycan/LPS O-acetylase OafA/YrhL
MVAVSAHELGAGLNLERPVLRIPALDGVRGLAILLVLVFHSFSIQPISVTAFDAAIGSLAKLGWCGVDLFFVLSGFLITGLLFDSKGGLHYFKSFYARRFLRIFPLYYAFLLLYFYVSPWVSSDRYVEVHDFLAKHQGWFWLYIQNWWFARAWSQGIPDLLNHFWSLAIEEQFYLLWPLIVFGLKRETLKKLALTVALASLVIRVTMWFQGSSPLEIYVGTFGRLDGLMLGSYVALAWRGPERDRLIRLALPLGVVSLLTLILIAFTQNTLDLMSPLVVTVGYTVVAALFASLLILVLSKDSLEHPTLFRSSPLRFLGKYSYAIYIFHWPVMKVMSEFYNPDMWSTWSPFQIFARLGFFSATATISLILSLVSWYGFESLFLRLKVFLPRPQ